MNPGAKTLVLVALLFPTVVGTCGAQAGREVSLSFGDEGPVLSGTLVVPAGPGPHPAVLLVSPAGDHPRDEIVSRSTHYRDLAEALAETGVASLRVDNPGIGRSRDERHASFDWSRTSEQIARDLEKRVRWLRTLPEVAPGAVGVLAHGDGCLPAALLASRDRGLAFVILLAPPGTPAKHHLVERQLADLLQRGVAADVRKRYATHLTAGLDLIARDAAGEAREPLREALRAVGTPEARIEPAATGFIESFSRPWYRHYLACDPAPIVAGVRAPILLVGGGDDRRHPPRAHIATLERALEGAGAFSRRVRTLAGLDHFLCEDDEATTRTFARSVVREILSWIRDCTTLCDETLLPGRPSGGSDLVIEDVTVIDVRAGIAHRDMNVDIRAGKIHSVSAEPVAPREGVTVVPGRGRWLIPALWDMHVHLGFWGADALPRLVAHGVLGVRDMGGDLEEIDRWRAAVAAGDLLGPHVVRAGPFVDGEKENFRFRRTVWRASDASRAVLDLKRRGVDFIKIHSRVPIDAYHEVMIRAREVGLPVAGHVPVGLTPLEASRAGQVCIDHVNGLLSSLARARNAPVRGWGGAYRWWLSEDGEAAGRELARNGTWIVPTLVTDETLAARVPRVAAVPGWTAEITDRLWRAGVRMMAGTDSARRELGIAPGAALHRELELLAKAGLGNLDALRCATTAPVDHLGLAAERGAIEPGRVADAVLLEADPLADISATRRIAGVVSGGAWIGRDELTRIRSACDRASGAESGERRPR